ncbi:MAG: protein kinase, partial [Chloroflexi bacterium]|nr:protein kinase [Chloroflexota bacterium]
MQPLAPGSRLGRFVIERVLGRGGMGVVYLARDGALGREVALKMIGGELAWNPEFLARFDREARSAARLSHTNVVHVYDVTQEGSQRLLVMEYVPGQTLSDRLHDQGALTPSQLISLARQLGAALDHAAGAGVLHRDVKPGNVLLAPDGRAVLTDFGLAFAAQDSRMTSAGMTMGSPLYMSPEQAAGKPLDHRSDLYSLAVLLYEALSGRPPFSAPSPPAVLVQHMTAPPPPINSVRPDLPPEVGAVFARALAKSPADRYDSGAQLADALERALGPMMTTQVQPVQDKHPSQETLLRTFGIGIVGAIVLGGGLFAVDRMTRKADPTPTATVVATGLTATTVAAGGGSPTASGLDQTVPGTPGTSATTGSGAVAKGPTPSVAPSPSVTVRPGTPTPTEAQAVDAAMADIAAPWSRADWDAVIGRLAPLQARYNTNPAVRDKLYAAYVEKGKVLEIAENPVEARRPYGAALQLDPSRPEARGRLQAIDPVKRALAWRNYRWKPGLQTEDDGLRTFQSGDGLVLQVKIPNSART